MYGLQILDATLEAGNTEEEDTAASALLLKHEFLDGGADDDVTLATLGKVLLEPLTTLGNFLVRSNSQSSVASASFTVGGFQLEGYAMTLSLCLEHCAHLHANAGKTLLLLPVPAEHGLQLGDVRQRGRQRLRGRQAALQGVWSTARLDFSVPPGGSRSCIGAFGGSISGLVRKKKFQNPCKKQT